MSLKLSRTAFLDRISCTSSTGDSCRTRRNDRDASFLSSSRYTCWACTLHGNPFRTSRSSRTACSSFPASPPSERRRDDASTQAPCPSRDIQRYRSTIWNGSFPHINDDLQHLLNCVEKLKFSLID